MVDGTLQFRDEVTFMPKNRFEDERSSALPCDFGDPCSHTSEPFDDVVHFTGEGVIQPQPKQ